MKHRATGADAPESAGEKPTYSLAPLILTVVFSLLHAHASWSQTLVNPRRIAEGPANQVLVADRTGSIVAVDMKSLETRWSAQLPDEGAPFGLATSNRLVFVGNTETKNVEVYRMIGSPHRGPELRWMYNLGHTIPGESGSIENPIDIAIDRHARLVFVLDGQSKLIRVFDIKGKLLESFSPVDSSGTVLSPVSIAVDPDRREVLVGDYGDPSGFFRMSEPARILVFDYTGAPQFEIKGNGSTHVTTMFARVQGLVASGDGRIFATDPLGSRVLVLDRTNGETLAEIGSEGSEPGFLRLPLDVFLEPKTGDLFVSNNQGARRVEVFRGAGRQR
ncbi:MAG: hypothetical protein OEM62_12210 [Acidobacteriota bacterium]|nr:hypothetical protein [Acidobacteriota bacterium]